ncbi:MAG: 4Fe-4S dicluster domain-containing protein [Telmatospirillum sp.]|nr:4Fe-4S dicluster domain-containing protein [Telmatospirillum sp.]
MSKGVLVDLTKCVGCGSCTVACKMYNARSWIDDRAPSAGPSALLADENWTVVRKVTVDRDGGTPAWRFVKQQCLHCEQPACASACFARALQKTEDGPVVYYPNLCVGCRYCMVACPFDIPKYEWGRSLPLVTKCMMCASRIAEGQRPACVSVCPTGAMTFGDRGALLEQAHTTISGDDTYVKHIYGEKEAGGTSWIYISDVDFSKIGFKTGMTEKPLPSYTEKYTHLTPVVGGAWGLVLAGLYVFNKRKKTVSKRDVDARAAAGTGEGDGTGTGDRP